MSLTRALRRCGGWIVVTALMSWFGTGLAHGFDTYDGGPDGPGASLEQYLDADGTLNLPAGFTGSLNPAGWNMSFDAQGRPVFTRAATAAASMAALAAGDEAWNPNREFNSMGANGNIYAVVVDVDGNVYVGGSFTKAGGRTAPYIAKFQVGSNNAKKWVNLADDLDGNVWALAIGPDGYVYAGGEFSTAGGVTVNNVARYTGSAWEALGATPGTNGTVYALAFSGNNLYVGGDFASAGSASAANVAVYNTLSGSWSALGSGTSGTVYALEVIGGNVYAGGSFATAGGTTVNNIARWSVPNELWFALENANTGINGVTGTVYALDADGSDLYLGGSFTVDVNGSDTGTNLARWTGTNFLRLSDGAGEGANGTVYSIAVRNTGTRAVYIGGAFTQAGSTTVSRVAVWDPAGEDFTPLDDAQLFAASGAGGTVRALFYSQRGSTDELYVAGAFTTVGGGFNVNRIAYWDLDQTAGSGEWRGLGHGVNGPIYALLVNNSRLYVGGDFDAVGGMQANNVAYLSLSDFSWNRLTNGGTLNGTDGPVYALAAYNDGTDNFIVVGGDFTYVPGATGFNTEANNLAYWDSNDGGTGVGTWGRFDDGATSYGTNGPVYALEMESASADIATTNLLYVGGSFTSATGTAANNIASFDATSGGVAAIGNGFNGPVYALEYHSNGDDLYVGGNFTASGSTSYPYLASINAGTTIQVWDGFGASGVGTNGPVYDLHIRTPGSALGDTNPLFIGGDFTSITYDDDQSGGGTSAGTTSASYIAIWDGASDADAAAPSTGTGVNGPVYALYFDGTSLFAGGAFTTANGTAASGTAYAVIESGNVTSWNAQGSGVNSTPRAVANYSESSIGYVVYAGEFTQAGDGQPSYGLAAYDPPTVSSGSSGGDTAPTTAPALSYLGDGFDIQTLDRTNEINAAIPYRVTLTWGSVSGASNYKLWYDVGAAQDGVDLSGAADYFGADTTYTIEITTNTNVAIEFVVCGTIATSNGAYNGDPDNIVSGDHANNGSDQDGACLTDGVDDDADNDDNGTIDAGETVSGVNINIEDATLNMTYNGTTYTTEADFALPSTPTSVVATVIIPNSISPTLYTASTSENLDDGDIVVAVWTDPSTGLLNGGGYGVHHVTSGQDLVFNIYGDNPVTPAKDGFAPGEYMRFFVFEHDPTADGAADANFSGTYYLAKVTFRDATPNFSASTIYEATSFEAYDITYNSHEHLISLQQGWNLMSTFLEPNGSTSEDIEDVFKASAGAASIGFTSGATSNFGLARSLDGGLYYPTFGINTIDTYDTDSGYQVYMSAADTLQILGSLPGDLDVSVVETRWTIIPYLRNERQRIEDALEADLNDIVAVRDNAGNAFIPAFGINQIEWMTPGQGYLIYMNDGDGTSGETLTLTFSASNNFVADSILTRKQAERAALGREVAEEIPAFPVPVQSTRFTPVRTQTGSSATLILESQELRVGDEIGVFNQAGDVVGVGVVEQKGRVAVTIWGDDIITEDVVDGAQLGEELTLRAWVQQLGSEEAIDVLRLRDVLSGAEMDPVVRYEENGVHAGEVNVANVQVSTEGDLGLPTEFELAQNYPNPFNPVTTIRYALPEAAQVTLEVFDITGRRVAQLVNTQQAAGRYEATWNGRNSAGQQVSSGVYFYRITAGTFTQTHRMVLLK